MSFVNTIHSLCMFLPLWVIVRNHIKTQCFTLTNCKVCRLFSVVHSYVLFLILAMLGYCTHVVRYILKYGS